MEHGRVLRKLGRETGYVTVAFNFGIGLQLGKSNRQPIDDALERNGHLFSSADPLAISPLRALRPSCNKLFRCNKVRSGSMLLKKGSTGAANTDSDW
jgi:hypothetical protein